MVHEISKLRLLTQRQSQTYLVPECITESNGFGPEVHVGANRGRLLVLTLGIHRVTEQQGLILSVWGSSDGTDWGSRPLIKFPEKFYCGLYSALLNLAQRPDVLYMRAEWSMKRWGKANPTPMFGFSVYTEESGSRIQARSETGNQLKARVSA